MAENVLLYDVLRELDRTGWEVDFKHMRVWQSVIFYKRMELVRTCQFLGRQECTKYSVQLRARYPFCARSRRFLALLREELRKEDIVLEWSGTDRLNFEWESECPRLFSGAGHITELLFDFYDYWADQTMLILSCTQLLSVCARAAKRGGTEAYRKLTPSRLVALCLCDLGESEYH